MAMDYVPTVQVGTYLASHLSAVPCFYLSTPGWEKKITPAMVVQA